ncbi:alpha/beta hydrolase [Flavobacterium psychrotolerans]|uniref:Alpha/beta hydrolase n=2 Tax=Flavobacterium psychrotolerans TaxID=2169410 RepID=A0A2U1JPY4_9FLAO|nr:alpha/beta hydrolase [Flavobacterium psychrotolerans]
MKNISHFLFTKSIGLYINLLSFIYLKKASQLAYAFFSEPRTGKLSKKNLPEILKETYPETFLHENQTFQTYTWKGNDTIILLVHGWESNASRWENILPYLKKSGSTIIALDGPAHGLSSGKEFSIPKYVELINVAVKKFQPQYLIGHSMGGKACLYYQSLYQNVAVQKMVILGSPSDFRIILNNYIALLSLNIKILKALEDHYLNHFKLQIDDFSGQLFASKIITKGLIAHDIDDTVVSFEEGKKIARSWKNSRFIETKGLGHSMHDEDLYNKIVRFLFEAE